MITDADAATYRTDMDRNMLCVSCTRAMHRLTMIGVGEMSAFVPEPRQDATAAA